jgi:hypothetical protein
MKKRNLQKDKKCLKKKKKKKKRCRGRESEVSQ